MKSKSDIPSTFLHHERAPGLLRQDSIRKDTRRVLSCAYDLLAAQGDPEKYQDFRPCFRGAAILAVYARAGQQLTTTDAVYAADLHITRLASFRSVKPLRTIRRRCVSDVTDFAYRARLWRQNASESYRNTSDSVILRRITSDSDASQHHRRGIASWRKEEGDVP